MRLQSRFPLFLIAAFGFLSASPAMAQRDDVIPSVRAAPETPTGVGGQIAAVFQLADRHLLAGEYDRAVAVMEDLYAAEPASLPVFTKLKAVYATAGRLGDVVDVIERRLAADGPSVTLLADLGTALHRAGRSPEASDAWRRAVNAAPMAEMTYRIVSNHLGQALLFGEAASTLRRGRVQLADSILYRAELANIYGLAGEYGAAADEYLALIVDNPDSGDLVRARLTRLIDAVGAAEAFSAAIARAIRSTPLNRAYRELAAWIALEQSDYATALDASIAIDRLQGEQGQSLFGFAQAAITGEAFDQAQRALGLIMERHPDGPVAPLAHLGMAQLNEDLAEQNGEHAFGASGEPTGAPHFEAALQSYVSFPARYPHHPSAITALTRAAELQQSVFRNYEAAEELLLSVVARSGNLGETGSAKLDLGRVALRRGDLIAARRWFTQVEEGLRIGPLAESARLELAHLDFYEGDINGAMARVDAMNQNTASDAANDAISLKLLLRENAGPDSTAAPLRAFATASLLQRQQRSGEALAALDQLLAESRGHPIADEAAFLSISALRALQRFDEVLTALEGFPTSYPQSYLVERSLFLVGEVHERNLGDPAAAAETYTRFLTQFPGSLLAPEVRSRLRRLRGDRPPG